MTPNEKVRTSCINYDKGLWNQLRGKTKFVKHTVIILI